MFSVHRVYSGISIRPSPFVLKMSLEERKVKVSDDRELVQSEPNSNSKTQGETQRKWQIGTNTKKTNGKLSEQLFLERWPHNYLFRTTAHTWIRT